MTLASEFLLAAFAVGVLLVLPEVADILDKALNPNRQINTKR
jgi:hypothetical protein